MKRRPQNRRSGYRLFLRRVRDKDKRFYQCTGCLVWVNGCACGRADKHRCVSCNAKLWDREGMKILWGAVRREVCPGCLAALPKGIGGWG